MCIRDSTLNDVFSYNEKHNEANGEDNKDGSDNNNSWNCGVEGPTEDANIIALRKRMIRNVLATMLLDGRAQVTGIRQRGKQATLLIVVNDHHDLVEFTLPECPGGDTWRLLIDTNITDNSETGCFK